MAVIMKTEEMSNFAMVWISVVASLCYCHSIAKFIKPGSTRFLLFLPVILLFLVLPLNLRTIFLGGPTSFFVSWLATFKLVLFAFGKGPLSSDPPLPLRSFVLLACFPIKIQTPFVKDSRKFSQKSPLNYAIKALIFATIWPVYQNKSSFHPKLFLCLYAIYTYTGLEIILAAVAAAARAWLGVELEPQFDEPYLSTSLQDFWGRRWNIMASNILRPTVYVPVREISGRLIGTKWDQLPAVVATFLVSGVMHEWIFYNIGRSKPTWEVTWFFVLHGVCLAVEIGVKKAVGGRWRLPPAVSGLMALAVVMASALWLFLPALMKCNADVMAHREMVAFFEFVKNNVAIRLRLDKAILFSSFRYYN
ncbi:hypothetical protein TIFTF001_006044 [Ficus carica]|uniref:Wax synthase domain-containing protein n=1 Tax=Ficus carica TaxID=3494 RepID=A0AA87ZQ92_FICCA|nr:hypothetical protein TIFTF001_006044 [Ficus carica]